MRWMLNIFQWIYSLYALLLFVLLMLIVFPFVLVASAWGKLRGGNFIYQACRCWADLWMFLLGIVHRNILEAPVDPSKQYVFVANHISYLDIPIILKSVRHHKFRVLGKYEMKRIPIFGYIYQRAAILVDRSRPEERSKSVRTLKSVLRKGISIFIYPEGTFNETGKPLKAFYDGAFRIAIETGTPIKPILFLDTFDRMPYYGLFTLNPGPSRAIFLEEVPVAGYNLKEVGLLKSRVYDLMEQSLIRYRASWIAEDAL
jgi:1-acyl-sn-glycerol-3-phosphate acyltransferase